MPDPTPKVVFSPEEIALINKYRPVPDPTALPVPPHPGIFQKEPVLQGPASLSAAMLAIMKTFPWLTQHTPTTHVTEGFTRDSADVIQALQDELMGRRTNGRIPPEDFPTTNVLGIHNPDTHNLTIRPNQLERPRTLVHELLHALGYKEPATTALDESLAQAPHVWPARK